MIETVLHKPDGAAGIRLLSAAGFLLQPR